MKASGRNWLLTIERKSVVQNSLGEDVETWNQLAQPYASKVDIRDGERIAAAEVSAAITTRFGVLWSPQYSDLNPSDRLICDGRTYDIWGVKEIGFREGFEITAAARAE